MFWRKRKYHDRYIGEFTFENGIWFIDKSINNKLLLIGIDGSKQKPSQIALDQCKSILENIIFYKSDALEFIKTQDILISNNNLIELDGFTSYQEYGIFDISFGLSQTKFDTNVIIVHYKNRKPYNISLID
ncbi:MAG: hypothetical protein HRU38_17510 [Saccharospirillaceae bacterium]|nr:hypothetical protein [Pseudomonadales bacterium]NRB80437.1 hypothetical protein [Saccharospirillaceae bacterium]